MSKTQFLAELEELAKELADEIDELDEPADVDADTDPPPRKRTWVRRVGIASLILLVLALVALSGYLGWQAKNSRDIKAAGDAALRAATSYAVTLTSVDSNNLDADFAAVLDGATGEFQDMYRKSSAQLRQLLVDHKATGHGVVVESAIQSASRDQVVVLLFVDQMVSNTEVPDPRVDHSRMVLTMRPVDGQWKAAKVELP